MMMKREYRGQRSVTAIADFIRQQKVDPIKEIHSLEEVNTADVSIRHTQISVLKCKRCASGICSRTIPNLNIE
jgi:hypothetical protein